MARTSESDSSVAGMRAADRLRAKKDRVISKWEARLRKQVPAANQEAHPVLINTLPALLEQLAQSLSPEHSRRTATEGSTAGAEHGGERVRLTHFRMEDLITEYKLLRQVLFEELDGRPPLSATERHILNTSLDQTMIEACTGYALVQATLRDQLFAIVAHDLRNPLGAAHTTAKLIQKKPTSVQVPHWAERIVHSIGRVDRMVQDLLDAMRVQTGGRLQLDIKKCDLAEVVRDALEHLEVEHGERFVVQAAEPVRGYFAPENLRRAVENLATNAVKYGTSSDPITVTIHQEHQRAFIEVHNHGTQIPMEKQETLFRAFQRTSAAEQSGKPGWGLGLAQVRAVAEAHGGSIVVDSTPDTGTTFTVDIPVDARPYQSSPTTSPTG